MSIAIVKNSLDKPFGVLANDAITPFTIGTQTYQSIVNYVYSNLLPDSTFKTELLHMHPDSGLLVAFFAEIKRVFYANISGDFQKIKSYD